MEKKSRKTYKLARNQQMYEDYLSGKSSYDILSRKYHVSRQRAHFLIHDYKKRGYDEGIPQTVVTAEKLNSKTVALLDAGKYEVALSLLTNLEKYAKDRKKFLLLIQIFENQVTASNKIAKNRISQTDREKYLNISKEALRKALLLCEEGKVGEAVAKRIYVQMATTDLYYYTYNVGDEHFLKEALKYLNLALENYPVPLIQKVWPLIVKSRVYYLMGTFEKALKLLQDVETVFHRGYKEINGLVDDKEVWNGKIITWLCMMHLTYAFIYKKLGENLMAIDHAKSIIAAKSSLSELVELKKEAQLILMTLEG